MSALKVTNVLRTALTPLDHTSAAAMMGTNLPAMDAHAMVTKHRIVGNFDKH